MKLTIDREELLHGLGRIQAIVERRGTLPILANVLIEAQTDVLTLSATDLEVGMISKHAAKIEEQGAATLGAKSSSASLMKQSYSSPPTRTHESASSVAPSRSACCLSHPTNTRACPPQRVRPSWSSRHRCWVR